MLHLWRPYICAVDIMIETRCFVIEIINEAYVLFMTLWQRKLLVTEFMTHVLRPGVFFATRKHKWSILKPWVRPCAQIKTSCSRFDISCCIIEIKSGPRYFLYWDHRRDHACYVLAICETKCSIYDNIHEIRCSIIEIMGD